MLLSIFLTLVYRRKWTWLSCLKIGLISAIASLRIGQWTGSLKCCWGEIWRRRWMEVGNWLPMQVWRKAGCPGFHFIPVWSMRSSSDFGKLRLLVWGLLGFCSRWRAWVCFAGPACRAHFSPTCSSQASRSWCGCTACPKLNCHCCICLPLLPSVAGLWVSKAWTCFSEDRLS